MPIPAGGGAAKGQAVEPQPPGGVTSQLPFNHTQGRKPQQVTIPLACFDHFVFRLLSSVWLRRGAILAVWIVLATVAAAWETENFSEKLTEQTISGHQIGQKCIITVG